MQAQKFGEAIQWLASAREKDPNNADYKAVLMFAFMRKAQAKQQNKEAQVALKKRQEKPNAEETSSRLC